MSNEYITERVPFPCLDDLFLGMEKRQEKLFLKTKKYSEEKYGPDSLASEIFLDINTVEILTNDINSCIYFDLVPLCYFDERMKILCKLLYDTFYYIHKSNDIEKEFQDILVIEKDEHQRYIRASALLERANLFIRKSKWQYFGLLKFESHLLDEQGFEEGTLVEDGVNIKKAFEYVKSLDEKRREIVKSS